MATPRQTLGAKGQADDFVYGIFIPLGEGVTFDLFNLIVAIYRENHDQHIIACIWYGGVHFGLFNLITDHFGLFNVIVANFVGKRICRIEYQHDGVHGGVQRLEGGG